MQVWRQTLIGEWIAWCGKHIDRGGTLTDYIPAPFTTWGFVTACANLGSTWHRAIPSRTIRYNGGDPATCPLYMPDGTIWLPDGPVDPTTEQTPPVPVFDDIDFCTLPGYLDLLPRL